jgi:Domain of unknown function (DUF4410)
MDLRTAALAVVTTCAMPACTSPPKPTEFTPAVGALGKGMFVDQAWVDSGTLHAGRYARIALGSVDVSRIHDQKGISASDAAAALTGALLEPGSADTVVTLPGAGGAAKLETAITELDPGDAFARVMAGELGAGHAWVQVEARLVDPATGKPVAVFVERSRDSGAAGLRDTFGSAGPTLVREMLKRAASDLRDELRALLPAPK